MKKKEKKKFWQSKKAVCLLLLAVAMLSFGSTWAYYNSKEMSLGNPLSTTHSGATMVEKFDPSSSFLPGETVAKIVAFENTGDMDLLLRVEVPPKEEWYPDPDDGDTLDEEYVIKNWSSAWATADDGSGNEVPFDMDTDGDYLNDYTYGTDQWSPIFVENETKYRYYNKVLSVGATTDAILDSITLSTEVSNDRHAADYSDKTYKLTFDAQAVPVEGSDFQQGAYAEWGMIATVNGDTVTWTQP